MYSMQARRLGGARRVALTLSALVVTAACSGGSAEETAPAADSTAIILGAQDVAVAERADIASGILLTGSLEPSEQVTIRAQVPGTMSGVRVDRGSRVGRGQVLASIEAVGIRSQAAGARATVADSLMATSRVYDMFQSMATDDSMQQIEAPEDESESDDDPAATAVPVYSAARVRASPSFKGVIRRPRSV